MALNGPGRNRRGPAPYVHKAWPAWFYGPEGQSQVFTSPLDVPKGWHDDPKKVGDPKAKTEIPGLDEALAGADKKPLDDDGDGDEEHDLPAYDDITANQIKDKLDEYGVAYEANDSKGDLYKLLSKAVEEARLANED